MSRRYAIAEIKEDELALRFLVIAIGLKPTQMTAEAAVEQAERSWPKKAGPFPFRRMARAAIDYVDECVKAARVPS